jgi:hypothetical protein
VAARYPTVAIKTDVEKWVARMKRSGIRDTTLLEPNQDGSLNVRITLNRIPILPTPLWPRVQTLPLQDIAAVCPQCNLTNLLQSLAGNFGIWPSPSLIDLPCASQVDMERAGQAKHQVLVCTQ